MSEGEGQGLLPLPPLEPGEAGLDEDAGEGGEGRPGLFVLPAGPKPGEAGWLDRIAEAATGDHGLELLVDLVRSHEIDPWDVDIKLVADRFLAAIDALKPEDLPQSGRLLFFTSVIIRLKAQVLAGRGSDLLQPDMPDDDLIDGSEAIFDPEGLGAGALRRAADKDILLMPRDRMRKRRPLTIQDLFDALQMSEAHEQKMLDLRSSRRGRVVVPFKSVREAMDTLHKDDLEADIRSAREVVARGLVPGGRIALAAFGPALDPISAFLALLFLEARGEIELGQDDFYGPIHVALPAPRAAEGIGEA